MTEKLKILIVEDLLTDYELAVFEIEKAGITVESIRVDTEEEFRRALQSFDPQIVISDYSMSSFDADKALKISLEHNPYLPFIILAGSINEETAVNCLKSGATDYVLKERIKRLPYAVKEAMARNQVQVQREQYLSKLKESENRLKQAHKIASIGSWEFNFDTGLVSASEEAKEIYGIDQDQIPIKEIQAMAIGQYRPMLDRAIKEHIETGRPYDVKFRIQRAKDGETRYVHSMAEYNRDTNCLVGIITDITEKKTNEFLRQEIMLARESTNIKRDFLAQMSHEIRTPLTAIEGIAELMEKSTLNEVQKDYMETLHFSVESLKNIINEVLDFSKIEAGKIVISPVSFRTLEIPEKTGKFFHSICKKPLRFKAEGFENLPEFIVADKQRIFQIITNLLSNAVKYCSKGLVKLRAAVDQNIGENEMRIKIEVIDEGPGIHSELKKNLFKPFSQLHSGNDDVVIEGTGLGLSICKELAVLMGGETGVESEHGKGSCFWFTFTAQTGKLTEAKDDAAQKGKLSKRSLKILLAEDKEVNKKVISLMLSSLGHDVVAVENGLEAFNMCKKVNFDLVLMDVQMPVMDGIEATQKIISECADHPPVVGLSANAMEHERKKYIQAGMADYIIKPFKTDDIVKVIEKLKI
ncbi:MAG: response regulator [Bacteroidales bacterium]